MSHLHWGQEGCEGDDVACNTQKGATNQTFAKVGKQPKAGIRCDEVTCYILGLSCLLLLAKIGKALFLFFLLDELLCYGAL